jgi:Sigma-70 region 2
MSAAAAASTLPALDVGEHVRLAYKVAGRYRRWAEVVGVEQEEVVGEALFALVVSGRKWDPVLDAFSTIAVPMIKRGVRRMLQKRRLPTSSLTGDDGGQREVVDRRAGSPRD